MELLASPCELQHTISPEAGDRAHEPRVVAEINGCQLAAGCHVEGDGAVQLVAAQIQVCEEACCADGVWQRAVQAARGGAKGWGRCCAVLRGVAWGGVRTTVR